ncbi:MAG: 3-oxoacyl-ACP synthase [Bacteroidota bacterium]|nr:3-oxoacyl-ACP synthase [Bacteroidota bacterium]
MNLTVAHHCRILDNCIYKDGRLILESPGTAFAEFSETAYRHFQLNYPKFHKMDHLSKLGLLASDILLSNNEISYNLNPETTGVIFSNRNSSLDTDLKYHSMLRSGVASPAVFVYSLPNIVIGEICIRNGFKGENTFFISDRYDIPVQVNYINQLFKENIIDACICGWLELLGENYEAFLYLAVKNGTDELQPHQVDTINALYHHL